MQIVVLLVTGEKLVYTVTKDTFIVGRAAKSDVVITHDGVSRSHCQIEHKDGEFFVTDLDSTNGVMIDSVKIPAGVRTEVKGFLPISFGPVQSLTINIEDPTYNYRDSNSTRRISSPAREPVGQKVVINPARKQSNKMGYYLGNLLALIILGGAIYWYVSKDSSPSSSPEKAAPVSSEDDF